MGFKSMAGEEESGATRGRPGYSNQTTGQGVFMFGGFFLILTMVEEGVTDERAGLGRKDSLTRHGHGGFSFSISLPAGFLRRLQACSCSPGVYTAD